MAATLKSIDYNVAMTFILLLLLLVCVSLTIIGQPRNSVLIILNNNNNTAFIVLKFLTSNPYIPSPAAQSTSRV